MALPSSIIKRDTTASKPAASAFNEGNLFSANDTPYVLERSNGVSWDVVANGPKIVVAAADESVGNDTLQNDDELFFTVIANTVYWFEIVAWFTTGVSNTPDVKYTFTMPAAATMTLVSPGYTTAATANTETLRGHNYQSTTGFAAISRGVLTTATQAASSIESKGIIRVGATAGTIQFQFAQNTADATALVRKADSYIRYQKVT